MSKSRQKRAYSYIRFSTPEQAKGDSLRRQVEQSKAWCAKNGYTLDESLNLRDLGVSAFKGKNATEGKLGAFLKAVNEGKVPKGSVLVVESLDRISRNEVYKAFQLFCSIIESGVTVVTLSPEEVLDREAMSNMVTLIVVIVILGRSYEESNTKSNRITAARDKARRDVHEKNKILTTLGPAWLDAVHGADGQKEWKVAPNAAKTITRIFKLKQSGVGTRGIAVQLNQDPTAWRSRKREVPYGPKTEDGLRGEKLGPSQWRDVPWSPSYVKKILANAAVIGQYQPYSTKNGK